MRAGDGAGSGAAKSQQAHRGGTADGIARRDEPDSDARDGEPGRDFAELLQAGTAGEGEAAAAPADTVAGSASAEPAAGNLPDQLLALLAGALAVPATPASQAVAAAAPATPASASARPTPSLPAALAGALPTMAAAAGAAPPASPAGTGAANATADGDAFAALAKLAVDAITDDGSTASAGDATQTPPLAATTLAPTAPGPRPAVAPGAPLALPADPDAGFDDGFGARIAWMAEQRLGHAEIRLNPEHLGPIDVRVQLDGSRVAAEFHSAHAEVRQAIEASVPRLREMLGQHGLQLGHADVGQRHAQGQAPRRDDARGDGSDADAGAARPTSNAPRLRSRGLLDEYA
ncbi:MAG TPA: flagellar hook-length control protein FliK [Luteimonas sp.]|nr:flagellar hook-length control protein FliK [Luteimonas sp.]